MKRFDLTAALEAAKAALPKPGRYEATVIDAEAYEKPDATWFSVSFELADDGRKASMLLCIDAPEKSEHALAVPRGLGRVALLSHANGVDSTAWASAEDIAADIIGARVRVVVGHRDREGVPEAAIRSVGKLD